ncbi:MAG: hypothetical protein OXM03_12635 [Chloroflexota bacterium]|nr:hypothetical protein [Chloroflexota bacterium]MDE2841466.1 hypothetical protein [Chloroflexota bacterium]MDE2929507.1 hypothetical protein [Chloroflexota bacterium]
MKRLTAAAFERAKAIVMEQGRDLDRALLEFHFEDGTTEQVLDALAAYQNDDGGFGHGLEPDLRTPASSVIATTVAFQNFRTLGVPAEHPLVRRGLDYLLDTFDASRQVWPIIPPEVEDAPHAPWWDYAGSEAGFGGFLSNPRVEIVGYLHDYSASVPADLLASVTTAVFAHLDSLPDEMEMHDLICFVGLAETAALPQVQRDRIWEKIAKAAEHGVAREPEQLAGYVLKPLYVVSSPVAALAERFAAEVAMNLDFEIEQQGADGAWSPNFSWGDQHPEAWEIAKREWQARITLKNLRVLRDFGRIETG